MGSQINLLDEIIVDSFAGGGGASTGLELALGRVVNIAINHDPAAAVARANLPEWSKVSIDTMAQLEQAVAV